MREGEKQELRLFQRESKIRKVTMSQAMATILLFIWILLSEYNKIRLNFAEKCLSYFMQCNNVFIFNFQKSQSFEKLYVSIPPSGNTKPFNCSVVAAYGLAPAERLLVSGAKLVQTSITSIIRAGENADPGMQTTYYQSQFEQIIDDRIHEMMVALRVVLYSNDI